MSTRRQLLELGAWLALGGSLRRAGANPASSRTTLLILGGTGFIGPHLTEQAQQQGWQVTHFNRGKTSADVVPGVETLHGDRNGQLQALAGRKWDVVIDDTGFVPRYVQMSAALLAPNVGYYLFVSSISVYASLAQPNDEHSAVGTLTDPETDKVTDTTYGPMKALCERYVAAALPGRCGIVRPGYIVGPLDRTDRFTYWPVRASKGGEMLAPGSPGDPIQVIDVRDLCTFMLRLASTRTTGTFNAVSAPRQFTMGELISDCIKASPRAHTQATWVPETFLATQWKSDDLDLPPWSPPSGDSAGAGLTSTSAAVKAGLMLRPLDTTVRDTLTWFQSLPPARQAQLHAGLDSEKEAATLRAWHEKSTHA